MPHDNIGPFTTHAEQWSRRLFYCSSDMPLRQIHAAPLLPEHHHPALFLQSLPPWHLSTQAHPKLPPRPNPLNVHREAGFRPSINQSHTPARLRSIMNLVSMCLPCVSVTPLARKDDKRERKKQIEEKTNAPSCACRHRFPHSRGRQSK